jgi:hypothetical protein
VIDRLENAGLVYGEIVHNLLYPAIYHPSLTAVDDNIELYDFRINKWVRSMPIPHLSGICEKTFHFRILGENAHPSIVFNGVAVTNDTVDGLLVEEEVDILPELMHPVDDEEGEPEWVIQPTDLTKYLFRQKTQELLFDCKEFNNMFFQNERSNQFAKRELKKQLAEFYRVMKTYIREKGLADDVFMRELMDDIYIVFRNLGSNPCITSARQVSQGRGDTYRVTSDEDAVEDYRTQPMYSPSPLKRHSNIPFEGFEVELETVVYPWEEGREGEEGRDGRELEEWEEESECVFEGHEELESTQNTCTSAQIIQMMRTCST